VRSDLFPFVDRLRTRSCDDDEKVDGTDATEPDEVDDLRVDGRNGAFGRPATVDASGVLRRRADTMRDSGPLLSWAEDRAVMDAGVVNKSAAADLELGVVADFFERSDVRPTATTVGSAEERTADAAVAVGEASKDANEPPDALDERGNTAERSDALGLRASTESVVVHGEGDN
jgi:hypothetical protein